MNLGLSGRAAIVTGARQGIGKAIALGLAAEGVDVAIVDVVSDEHTTAVERAVEAAGARALSVAADVANSDRAIEVVEGVVETFGRLDIVICNAGITRDGVAWKLSEDRWDAVLDVNLKGAFNYNRAASRIMMTERWGRIVNIASINGLRGKFGQSNYAASKGGMIAMSKSLARELGKFNVTVNVVAPGMVQTEMMGRVPAEFTRAALDETVLGRFAEPEDVADAVVFLCSDRARHITGEVLKVDGGQYI